MFASSGSSFFSFCFSANLTALMAAAGGTTRSRLRLSPGTRHLCLPRINGVRRGGLGPGDYVDVLLAVDDQEVPNALATARREPRQMGAAAHWAKCVPLLACYPDHLVLRTCR